jgi:P27 family predicted phage terminase small subunit
MGKRGPAKMPTPLKVLHGEKREERLNRDAPKASGKPVMPAGMSKEAQRVWRHQLKAMGATGVLTAADVHSLRAFCEAVVRYEYAAQMLEGAGPLIQGARKGDLIRNPLHQIVRDNAMLIRLFGRELGFLPSARESLTAKRDEERDPLAVWIEDA